MIPSRVLVVSPKFLPDYAGWLQQTLTMVQACDPQLVTYTWICPRANGQPEVEKIYENLTVWRIGSPRWSGGRLARVAFGLSAGKYLCQHRVTYDVVYCPWAYTPSDLITIIAALIRKPSVIRVADSALAAHRFAGRIRKEFFKRLATALIVLNRRIYAQLGEPERAELCCFFNGVDTHRFQPCSLVTRTEIRQQTNLSKEQKCILFVGSMVPQKGIDTLVSAFIELAKEDSQLLLFLAGPIDSSNGQIGELQGFFVDDLRSMVERYGLASRVRFLGLVHEVSALMQAADIFVLPSLAEGMPNVLLEAMATGLPCVATDIPGIQELIADGVNGLLFSPGDTQALANNLIRLLNDPAEAQRLGNAARQTIESQFSIEQTAQNYQALFLRLASRGNNGD